MRRLVWLLLLLVLARGAGRGRAAVVRAEACGANLSPGAAKWVHIEELSISGWATVAAVEPCPAIESGPGRVVLMTVTHRNSYVHRVHFVGEGAAAPPLEVTGYHKLWSATRNGWTAVEDLAPGEQIRTQTGTQTIGSLDRLPGEHRVFNFEVEGEHCYFAGALRVLGHNADCDGVSDADLNVVAQPTQAHDAAGSDTASGDGTIAVAKTEGERNYFVTEKGAVVLTNQSKMRQGFDDAGFPRQDVVSPTSGNNVGTAHALPDGRQVRLMKPDGRNGKRVSFGKDANGGHLDADGDVIRPPQGMTKAERREFIRERNHVKQE